MPYSAKILLDSISPAGRRLTTFELTYPRMVHAELMTHREFSRCSASSRAIPNEKLRRRVAEDPALPVWWGKNQVGMQAREELVDVGQPSEGPPGPYIKAFPRSAARETWLNARDAMLAASEALAEIGLHKQICNRLVEPWMFITVIVTSTNYDNWDHLRRHKDAQPEIAHLAGMMHEAREASVPVEREEHLPLISEEDVREAMDLCARAPYPSFPSDLLKKVSVGRCARVSYLNHDGKRDLQADIDLHDRLLSGAATGDPLHLSPFEHVATALPDPDEPSGNFRGWRQYRKEIPGECKGAPAGGVWLTERQRRMVADLVLSVGERAAFAGGSYDQAQVEALIAKLGDAS